MSIELITANPTTPKPTQAAAGKSTAASASATAAAGSGLGFFAMLSAADDALALSTDASSLADDSAGLPAGLVPEDGEDLLARDADASALAGWLLGVPVPTAPDVAPRGVAGRANGAAGGAPDTGAVSTLQVAGRKAGKVAGTSELQQQATQNTQTAAALPQQGHEDPSKQLTDTRAVLAPELAPAPALDAKELASVAAAVSAGERHAPHAAEAKAAPVEGGYFQSQAGSAPMGMDGVVATQSAAPLEAYVAEQVSYWISQDVQNAELTLDGMGFSPVEVSISMQGNEAQVAFRTDELQARDAIQNASEQLRDSLQRQGVMLTGMSVGTSDSGDASGQGRRQRQEGRQAVATAVVPVQVDSAVRPTGSQGRAVDLFV